VESTQIAKVDGITWLYPHSFWRENIIRVGRDLKLRSNRRQHAEAHYKSQRTHRYRYHEFPQYPASFRL
jgi:hypothetical protein